MRARTIAMVGTFVLLNASGCAVTDDRKTAAALVIDDRVITSTINSHYAQFNGADTTCIRVESLYGVVLLSGFVKTPQEKLSAQNIAERVEGVKSVHNEILLQADAAGWNTASGCRANTGHG